LASPPFLTGKKLTSRVALRNGFNHSSSPQKSIGG
jgi:hypothetical protein